MRLSQLRDLVEAIDAGGIRAAARRVGVSQPALTKSIRQLEEELHVRLLQRNARGVVPTREGRALATRARAIQAELRKAREEIEAIAGKGEGGVAIGAGPLPSVLIVPASIERFRAQHPEAPIRVVEGSPKVLLPLLRDETIDFMISQKPAGDTEASLAFRPLMRTQLAVVGRSGHPLRDATDLRVLAGVPWLVFSQPGGPGAMLEQLFARAKLPLPRSLIHCESYAAALALLSRTDTLGLIDPRVLREPFARGFLQVIRIDAPAPAFMLGLVTRAGVPLTRSATAMVRAIRMVTRDLVQHGPG